MKKGGLTVENVGEKLRELHGNMAAVGRHFGVTRGAVWKFVRDHPSLRPVVDDCREAMKDHAESALHSAVFKGEAWAVCFYLKTQAKDRGYIERQEVRNVSDDEIDAAIEEELERVAGGGEVPVPGTAEGEDGEQ